MHVIIRQPALIEAAIPGLIALRLAIVPARATHARAADNLQQRSENDCTFLIS
jgi:hypothetical protein